MNGDTDRLKAHERNLWPVTIMLRVVRELGFPAAVTAFLLWQAFNGSKATEQKLDRIVTILDERLPKR